MTLPEVNILSLGGTIAMTETGEGGVEPTLTGEDLVSAVPQLSDVAYVSAVPFRQIPGAHLSIYDLIDLAADIERRIDDGADGIVVTQGTDTIEESAFALDLLVDRDVPVVVTGAMRNPTLPGADGPANLLAAVRVTVSKDARGLGTVVVLNDEIHAARFVQKAHTSNPAAFCSPLAGPVGWISEGVPRVILHPVKKHKIKLPQNREDHRVALLTITLGDDGRLLKAVEREGYTGLVIEALGGGHVPLTMVEALEDLADKMPVVLASRTGSGYVLTSTYGFPGSETDLLARGLVSAGALGGPKARLLLDLLLRIGTTHQEIRSTFDGWLD